MTSHTKTDVAKAVAKNWTYLMGAIIIACVAVTLGATVVFLVLTWPLLLGDHLTNGAMDPVNGVAVEWFIGQGVWIFFLITLGVAWSATDLEEDND